MGAFARSRLWRNFLADLAARPATVLRIGRATLRPQPTSCRLDPLPANRRTLTTSHPYVPPMLTNLVRVTVRERVPQVRPGPGARNPAENEERLHEAGPNHDLPLNAAVNPQPILPGSCESATVKLPASPVVTHPTVTASKARFDASTVGSEGG